MEIVSSSVLAKDQKRALRRYFKWMFILCNIPSVSVLLLAFRGIFIFPDHWYDRASFLIHDNFNLVTALLAAFALGNFLPFLRLLRDKQTPVPVRLTYFAVSLWTLGAGYVAVMVMSIVC